jgi:hypothetical protein
MGESIRLEQLKWSQSMWQPQQMQLVKTLQNKVLNMKESESSFPFVHIFLSVSSIFALFRTALIVLLPSFVHFIPIWQNSILSLDTQSESCEVVVRVFQELVIVDAAVAGCVFSFAGKEVSRNSERTHLRSLMFSHFPQNFLFSKSGFSENRSSWSENIRQESPQ